MITRIALLALAVGLAPSVGRAQTFPASEARRVDSVFAAVDKTTSPGCALAIYRNGEIVYSRGYGMANLEHGIAISPRSVFDIGSTSKQFAAAAIVLLAQDGKLSIDDEVRKHIPELPVYQRPVTLRHLLNHTSGMRDYLTLMQLHGTNFDGVTGDQEALDLIVRQKAVNFDPGSEFLYSNSGFFMLSQVVKRVSGKTLAQFAEERIFGPLGMRNTHFHDDHTHIVANRATGYGPGRSGFVIDMSLFEQTGDGAINTSVEDLLKWDNNFYTPTVGGEGLLRDLHTQGKLNSGRTIDYALGLFVDQYRGLRRVRHGGSWAGYRAELLRFPEAKTSVACLCNLGTLNPSAFADAVAEIVLKERFTAASVATSTNAPSVTLSTAQLARVEGYYRDPFTGDQRRMTARNGRLLSSRSPQPFSTTDSVSFQIAGAATLKFDLGGDGKATRMTETVLTSGPQVFERFTPVIPTQAQLSEYAGAYFANEVDVTYQVLADSSGIKLEYAGNTVPLAPSVKDVFTDGRQLSVTFARDGRGKIARFSINAGRVRGIVAERR